MQFARDAVARLNSWYLSGDHAVRRVMRADSGQGLAEYALILALIAVIAIAALVFLGTQISGILDSIGQSL
jgi:pilus assembly protein Flp/PilA